MNAVGPAEELLTRLGVTEPAEIDLEAIAYDQGVKVRYRPLNGCEAHIVGSGASAIITVNQYSGRRRKRFSIAHELGHWHYDRGKQLSCRTEGRRDPKKRTNDPERRADEYAAGLLMPSYLFKPKALSIGKCSVEAAQELANIFSASLTATMIRLVELGPEPAVLIRHTRTGQGWFVRSPGVPRHWFPNTELHPDSYAMDVLYGSESKTRRHLIGADAWFNNWKAPRHNVLEQTVKIGEEEILSLVTITDGDMLEDN